MAYHSDLVGQILNLCMPIKNLDQESILSEIHIHNLRPFNAVEEVALGRIHAAILNLPYLLSIFCMLHIIFACSNTYLLVHSLVLRCNGLVFNLRSVDILDPNRVLVTEISSPGLRSCGWYFSLVWVVYFATNSSCSVAVVSVSFLRQDSHLQFSAGACASAETAPHLC